MSGTILFVSALFVAAGGAMAYHGRRLQGAQRPILQVLGAVLALMGIVGAAGELFLFH